MKAKEIKEGAKRGMKFAKATRMMGSSKAKALGKMCK